MDQPAPHHHNPPLFSDQVIVDGTLTPVSLFSDNTLWCLHGGQRCLHLEKHVLGFVSDGPDIIRIKTILDVGLETRSACSPRITRGRLVRKDVVFQCLSEESHRLLCQKLRESLDSFGKLSPQDSLKHAYCLFLCGRERGCAV